MHWVVAALAAASTCHPAAARLHGASEARLDETGMRHEPVDEAFIAGWIADRGRRWGPPRSTPPKRTERRVSYDAALAEMERWLRGSE